MNDYDDDDTILVRWTRSVACTAVLSLVEARMLVEEVAGTSYPDNATAEDLVSYLQLLSTEKAHELGEAIDRDCEPSEYTEGISEISVSVWED